MYANGIGVLQDDVEAVRWQRRAAEQGDASAQSLMGLVHEDGRGVPQDYVEAVRWYRRAAEQDNASAQVTLGFFYSLGRSVLQDNVLAHMWLNLGASKLSGELRERAIRGRDDVASRMAPADINEAQRLAREWRPRD